MDGRMIYSTTTKVVDDEYTNERENNRRLSKLGVQDYCKVRVCAIAPRVSRVKYRDANWMV